MKVSFSIAVFAFLSARVADAACPNSCSGHGRCTNYAATYQTLSTVHPLAPKAADIANGGAISEYGYSTDLPKKDSCTCFLRKQGTTDVYDFTNPDCSGKTCPSGIAYNAVPDADNSHKIQVECSNVGTCDRATGVCKCQPGFTGNACNRRTCPNNCSGRGQCKLLSEIIAVVKGNSDHLPWDSSALSYSGWDAEISAGCLCDAGYKGPDCSIVECPSHSDPMGGYGSESGRECSGRGQCDHEKGICKCYTGYHGTACEQQSIELI